jgi:hypothetical protein
MNGAMDLVRTHSFYQSFITLSVIRKPDLNEGNALPPEKAGVVPEKSLPES